MSEPDEILGKHLSIFHTPDQMESVNAANRQLKETGEYIGEIWHVRKDGSVFPTVMHNSLLRDEAGNPIGMIGTLRDISDIKQVEEALRKSHNELEQNVTERTLELTLTWGLGGMAVVLVLMLMGTGVLLKFVYEPLPERAYESILYLQRDVLFGSLIRNIHHWSGKLLLIVVFLHFLRVFFTGAFHPPRQFNWIIGIKDSTNFLQ